jgi:hypothetical protein
MILLQSPFAIAILKGRHGCFSANDTIKEMWGKGKMSKVNIDVLPELIDKEFPSLLL